MDNVKICTIEGCNNSAVALNHYFEGIRYCRDHYQEVFSREMEALWQAWEKDCPPPERLRYLIGRWYSEFETTYDDKPFLTQGMVKHSSFNWIKTKDGAKFTVPRRPMNTGIRLIYAIWRFDLQNKAFRFLRHVKEE